MTDIDHVVVLFQENRSFDHFFGTRRGVAGFASSAPDYRNPFAGHPDGFLRPYRLDSATTAGQCGADPDHSWAGQHTAWNGGANDGFAATISEHPPFAPSVGEEFAARAIGAVMGNAALWATTVFEAPLITDWRRATSGDLADIFDFSSANTSVPDLPDTAARAATLLGGCGGLPAAAPPAVQSLAGVEG